MKVSEILNQKGRDIFSVSPESTVFEAIEKMAEYNIGALLVIQDSKLKGIISERDYRNKVILKGRTSKSTPVSDIMSEDVICVEPTDSVNLCMQLMTNKKIRHLPVLDNEQVVGVISIGDVVKTVIANQKSEIDSLRSYIGSGGGYPT
ncbi:MAG: histidine kinase [Balneola sp.]|jgi:CBS domain-containing protein|nr:histidine kinase [Balneola sp.]MBE80472.1 histidine kinase [Balneola sp.]HBX67040.1 histidine kinase [Balneolaceae bacterium]|tara:strand:- start:179 stop:622 length:444 start_codon:yes stop_codon:yes gene_type:complete